MSARVKKMRKDKKERRQKERLQELERERGRGREEMELISEEEGEKGRQNIYGNGRMDVFADENRGWKKTEKVKPQHQL